MTQSYVLNTTFRFDFHNEFFVTAIGILGPVILILNMVILISIVLILVKGQNKPKSYVVLGNICFANLISILIEIIITCKSAEPYHYDYQPNKAETAFLVSSNMASMWSICFIAIDRLIYIVYAIEYDKMMNLKVVLSITLLTWCVGGFIGVLPKKVLDKTVMFQNGRFQISLLLLVQIVTSTFIAVVILVTYLSLYFIYRKKMLKKETLITMKYTFKTTVIAMLSCASFVISWEPFLISMIIYYMFCPGKNDYLSRDVCRQISMTIISPLPITSLLNAFFNPTVYIWWHRPFIQDIKHIYCAKRLREQKRTEFLMEFQQTLGPHITTHL